MTVEQLKSWLREWVANATNLPADDIDDTKPLESFGLASRDAVILSGELETLLDTRLDPTIAYEYPTIAQLATRLIDGAPHSATAAQGSGQSSASSRQQRSQKQAGGSIAIVGMAGRFPQANDLEEYWSLLIEGRTATGELPVGRWSEYKTDPVMSAKMEKINLSGGYFDDIASFDPEFFGLSPLEVTNMDPQQRIMLELTWQALENAHLPANQLRGESVGVYVGSSNNDYGMLISADPAEAHPYALTGTASSIIPNRISYAFDFRGPSVNVDTACSSSLVSLHQAIKDLRDGDCDVALAGGVNVLASPFVSTAFGELGVISPTGAIHAFSDDADGFVRSDAAGMLVLKRLEDAEADGDEILAVVKGSATNSDGHSNGLTAPNPEAQVDVLRRAYADAEVDPTTVDYVETHGTGTILGDPIEASALGTVLGSPRDLNDREPTLIGSVKSNIGHSESAAGVASVIKVVLAMNNDTLPPSVNFSAPNRYIDFDAEKVEVVDEAREWPSEAKIAGVSGFGFGGTNAHVVMQAYQGPASGAGKGAQNAQDAQGAQGAQASESADAPLLDSEQVVLPVSGMVPSRARAAADQLAEFLDDYDGDLTSLGRSLAKRNHGRTRAAIVATEVEQAATRLHKFSEGKVTAGVSTADSPETAGPVFVYSGFGSQHRLMAKDLCAASPTFARRIAELDEIVDFESGWSIRELIDDDEQTYNTETAQVAITAIQIALTDLLAEFGARPAAVIGMSMGEIAAAYAAGGLTADDAMLIACHRARLMGEGESTLSEEEQGAMAVVELSAEEIASLADGKASDDDGQPSDSDEAPDFSGIEPAVYAGPGMTTVGGPRAQILSLVDYLDDKGKFARALDVKGAGHTSMVEPLLGELEAEIAGIEAHALHTPLFSSVDCTHHQVGAVIHADDYWLKMTRQPVYFQDAVSAALAQGHNTLVEVSPNPVALMGMMNTAFSLGKSDARLLKTLKRKEDASACIVELLAQLYVTGAPIDLTRLYGRGPITAAPHTPMKKQRYWTNARPSSVASGLPGTRVSLPDGTAFSIDADQVPSTLALLETAAQAAAPGAELVAAEEYYNLPAQGELTTIAQRNVGGVGLTIHDIDAGRVVAEGFATTLNLSSGASVKPVTGVAEIPNAQAPTTPSLPGENDSMRWDPAEETVEQRLRAIVSESMGYDVDDLPGELPLIDLGLDSLMGMRIKNRVENDFQIPPLQVQALRDASVADVVTMVTQAVESKEGKPESDVSRGNEPAAEETSAAQPATPETSAAQPSAAEPSADEKPDQPDYSTEGVGVAPRDAAERLVFATWATFTGTAARGVTSALPEITAATAQDMAERLSDRAGRTISAELIVNAASLEDIANEVREGLETDVEGNIRVLREGEPQSPVVFMFHPAGGSSVVYQPLMRRLPENISVYGVERLEGTLEERAEAYVSDIKNYARSRPVIVGGWSFGGALAYEVASQLQEQPEEGVEIAYIALLDTTQPSEPIPDTLDEAKARWQRYANFAERSYGLDFPVPFEILETAGEEALIGMLEQFLASTDASQHGLSAGVLEHQRASFVDNHILGRLDFARWANVDLPVLLFRSERMHDGAIELEPRYAHIDTDGGWGEIVDDLEIVQLPGDHLAVVDEPAIGIVGKHMSDWIVKTTGAHKE